MEIRRLNGADSSAYHVLCEEARQRPAFFYEYGEPETLPLWLDEQTRDPNYFIVGAFERSCLVGLVSLSRRTHPRWCHRASFYQVYARNDSVQILTELLSNALVLARGMEGVRLVELTLSQEDGALEQAARELGFECYGLLPEALQLDGGFHSEHLFFRRLEL